MQDTIITNAKIIGYQELQKILINEQGLIQDIAEISNDISYSKFCKIYDAQGDWVSLGGLDLQINGALGLSFTDIDETQIPKLQEICYFLWKQGINSFLPTIVTTSIKNIQKSLSAIRKFIEIQNTISDHTAQVLGVHLEGPFLNYQKKGAHSSSYLLEPSISSVKKVLEDYEDVVKIVTLAPELDKTRKVIPYLLSKKIIVSLGHSQANAEEAKIAFAMGASMVTHAYNAMPYLHHRQPGLLGEAIIDSQVFCGLIADGHHVCTTMMDLLLRSSFYDKGIFLVSDALAPMGLGDGFYPWDNREIEVIKGTAKLADKTLAGTTLSLLTGVQNLVSWKICSPEVAIALATESPRKAINLPGISAGQPAHLIQWYWDKLNNQLNWQRIEI